MDGAPTIAVVLAKRKQGWATHPCVFFISTTCCQSKQIGNQKAHAPKDVGHANQRNDIERVEKLTKVVSGTVASRRTPDAAGEINRAFSHSNESGSHHCRSPRYYRAIFVPNVAFRDS